MAMPMDGETFITRSFRPTPRPDSSVDSVPSTVLTTGEYSRPTPQYSTQAHRVRRMKPLSTQNAAPAKPHMIRQAAVMMPAWRPILPMITPEDVPTMAAQTNAHTR